MEGNYEILLAGVSVGQARIKREGLYYCFQCHCRFSSEVIYKLTVTCNDVTENLGIPVPEGDHFVLETRIPIKRLGEGIPVIRAVPKHNDLQGKFIPLSPTEPFAYLSQLESAFLEKRDGKLGVVIMGLNT